MYDTLIQSDTVQSYGHAKTDTSPVGVELSKKPKDLSVSESEDRWKVSCLFTWISTILYTSRVRESQCTCITWDV